MARLFKTCTNNFLLIKSHSVTALPALYLAYSTLHCTIGCSRAAVTTGGAPQQCGARCCTVIRGKVELSFPEFLSKQLLVISSKALPGAVGLAGTIAPLHTYI